MNDTLKVAIAQLKKLGPCV